MASRKSSNSNDAKQQGLAKIKSVNTENYEMIGAGKVSMIVYCTKTGKVKTALDWVQGETNVFAENGATFVMKRGKTYEVIFPTVGYRTAFPGSLLTIYFGKFRFFCGKSGYAIDQHISGFINYLNFKSICPNSLSSSSKNYFINVTFIFF